MGIAKDTLGLAGEFAAASELCRRGIYAQLTLGNRKSHAGSGVELTGHAVSPNQQLHLTAAASRLFAVQRLTSRRGR
jgi:hypothetical protein